MSLADLMRKGSLRGFATATPATAATHEGQEAQTVARVATVAVANAPASTAAKDPQPDADRWCWPNDSSPGAAMNGAEIALFVRRHARMLALGFSDNDADRMADRLKTRDREDDPRCSCAECRHATSRACSGGCPLPMALLHRCSVLRPALA